MPDLMHQLIEADGRLRCTACGRTFEVQPKHMITCLGAPVFNWEPWPEGMYTARQLKDMGLLPGPLTGLIPYSNAADGSGYLKVYRLDEALPKPALSPARAAAVAKMRTAREANRTCKECKRVVRTKHDLSKRGLCSACVHREVRRGVIEWAHSIIKSDAVIVDLEATGLGKDAEIISITVIDLTGAVLLDTFVKPVKPIREVEFEDYDEDNWRHDEYGPDLTAYGVNQISNAMVAAAPGWAEVAAQLYPFLIGRTVIAYNAEFDQGMIASNCKRHGIRTPNIASGEWECLMLQYSAYVGEWSGKYDDYKYQSLWTAWHDLVARPEREQRLTPHTARGDCFTALAVLRALADIPLNVKEETHA